MTRRSLIEPIVVCLSLLLSATAFAYEPEAGDIVFHTSRSAQSVVRPN